MRKLHINLSLAAKIVAAIMILGCAMNSGASYFSFSQLKVGGPVYQRVVLGKDLVADILPPPEYLVEAYLEANLVYDEPARLAEHRARLTQLRKDYDERHAYWAAQELDPTVRDLLLKSADAPAQRFWATIFDKFLPALERDARGEAEAAFKELGVTYGEHRAAIDKLVVETNRFTADIEAQAGSDDRWMTVLMAFFALSAFAVTYAAYLGVVKLIVRPVGGVTEVMSRMAAGDLPEHVPYRERPDEIGDMGRAMEIFLCNEQDRQRLARTEKLTREREIARQEQLQTKVREFSADIGASVASLGDQTGAMRSASAALNADAASVKHDAQNAAQASSGAASNSQAVAAATVQLEASIREIAAQAERARDIVDSTAEVAAGACRDVEGLSESSRQIDSILDLIRTIAGRTNLLALNATIEAARAGEAGRGFAVVANEVKALSEQTGRAVDEIVAQIGQMHQSTGAAVSAISAINGKVDDIREMTQAIADAVSQQEEATGEIAQNVTLAAERSEEAAHNVQAVSVTAEKTDAQAGRLASVSETLTQAASRISQAMEAFVAVVQTDLQERRSALRQSVNARVEIEVGGRRMTVHMQDISLTGLKVVGDYGFKTGERATVFVEGQAVAAQAVWAEGELCGLQFVTPLASLPPSYVLLTQAA